MGETVTMDRKLWLTAAKDRLVEDGDPDARFLFCVPGRQVAVSELERLGANFGTKQRSKTEDKSRKKADNKSETKQPSE